MIKHISSEKGLTLVELLAFIVISSILSGVIISVFLTGIKLYQKIGIESQLRDDGDYVATMILNELYNSPPDYVAPYEDISKGSEGIELVRYKPKTVEGFLIEDTTEIEDHTLIYQENQKFYIEKLDVNNHSIGKTEINIEGSRLTTLGGDHSSISVASCSQTDLQGNCKHGRIQLNLVLDDSNQTQSSFLKTDPLSLKSTFGF